MAAVVVAVAAGLLIAGFTLIYEPAGLIVAGLLLIGLLALDWGR